MAARIFMGGEMKKITITILGLFLMSPASYADNAWGNYHWARTTSSFDLTVVNSTTDDWDAYVKVAVSGAPFMGWSYSDVLNMVEDENGNTKSRVRRQCKGPAGQVRICNLAYGQNGWLGIAGISIDSSNHITTGYTKLNDTYFSMAFYDTPEWKQSVTCQELGHNVGLGHQDEDFNNESLYSCMDYQNPPYEYPDDHDYATLMEIYDHLDSSNSYDNGDSGGGGDGGGGGCNAPQGRGCNAGEINGHNGDIGWGVSLGRRGQHEAYVRTDPDGMRHITHVTWAIGF
jgi:hypothetical protein